MADWLVTLPKAVEWLDYLRELDAVLDGQAVLNYRVHRAPRHMAKGDRMFILWRGKVRGWMTITGIANWPQGFQCQTTGVHWPPGFYVQRSGKFHPVFKGEEMRGFQGVRRYRGAPDLKEARP